MRPRPWTRAGSPVRGVPLWLSLCDGNNKTKYIYGSISVGDIPSQRLLFCAGVRPPGEPCVQLSGRKRGRCRIRRDRLGLLSCSRRHIRRVLARTPARIASGCFEAPQTIPSLPPRPAPSLPPTPARGAAIAPRRPLHPPRRSAACVVAVRDHGGHACHRRGPALVNAGGRAKPIVLSVTRLALQVCADEKTIHASPPLLPTNLPLSPLPLQTFLAPSSTPFSTATRAAARKQTEQTSRPALENWTPLHRDNARSAPVGCMPNIGI